MAIHALLIGNNHDAPYHPLNAIQERLIEILRDSVQVNATDDTTKLKQASINQYDLLISYRDNWKQALAAEEAAGVLQFVANGGGLLVIHNGISMQASPELCQLIGAKFTGHPAYTSLPFQVTAIEHPLMDGLKGFVMDEEPYRFELDPFAEVEILLTYRHEEQDWPAAWTRPYGMGRVVFLAPGHHLPSFLHEEFGRWILHSAKWAAGGRHKEG
ncbi:ThuA domain-containing protein [Paenibacillus puerhi]|uniref:ThuA domain-containing protein n=1 Tax=Paenibacillus puerhi TaxID=2692622 RepID=UPI001358D8C4|nr:ThuA domain-containing protein [Paenibacillus puerhi]